MKRMSTILTLLLSAAMLGPGSPPVRSFDGGDGSGGAGNGPPSGSLWQFTHPVDGSTLQSITNYLGYGPSDQTGAQSVYAYNNVNPNGVYPFELEIQSTVLVVPYVTVWTAPAVSEQGQWYATIAPYRLGEIDQDPFKLYAPPPEEEFTGPTADMIMASMNGDGVLYQISPNAPE